MKRPERVGRVLGVGASATLVLVIALTALTPQALARSPASYLAGDRSLVKSYALLEGAKLGVSLPGGP